MTAEPAIVLVEDEAEIRRFLRVTLHAHGYRLFEATNGSDGLVEDDQAGIAQEDASEGQELGFARRKPRAA